MKARHGTAAQYTEYLEALKRAHLEEFTVEFSMFATSINVGLNNKKLMDLGHVKACKTGSIDTLAGYACPAANICQSFAKHGRVELGKNAEFVCYAARTEAIYHNSYLAHKENMSFFARAPMGRIAEAIIRTVIILKLRIVRIHASGDLFRLEYAKAYLLVATALPDTMFFGYTKIYRMYRLMTDCNIANIAFAFSMGSKDDSMVQEKDVTCTVITSKEQAAKFPHDIICGNHKDPQEYSKDFDYIYMRKSFGIALH